MFDLIKTIEVDRKNSLPVADLHSRYKNTGTPVVFGDLTHRWPASRKWSIDYFDSIIGNVNVPLYSDMQSLSNGKPDKPIQNWKLKLFLDQLLYEKNDLRVSKLPMKEVAGLERDFLYPRLGLNFNKNLTSLSITGEGVTVPMIQASNIVHTVHCNFGGRASVLLIPPEFSGFMYRVGGSQNTVREIDFDKPQFDKYPALKNLSGYVADLNHGDALYIPSGFWYCVAYQDLGITLSFESLIGSFTEYAGTMRKNLLGRIADSLPGRNSRLTRLENRTIAETNARLLKAQS